MQGDQVFISYGRQSNDSLLQYYGFVEPNIAHDTYTIPDLQAAALALNDSAKVPGSQSLPQSKVSHSYRSTKGCSGYTGAQSAGHSSRDKQHLLGLQLADLLEWRCRLCVETWCGIANATGVNSCDLFNLMSRLFSRGLAWTAQQRSC